MATGEVWCDVLTNERCADVVEFITLPPLRVKGKAMLQHVYRVSSVRSDQRPRPPRRMATAMIGRAVEMSTVREQLVDFAVHGLGKVIMIEGEMGIGKSWLMREIVNLAQVVLKPNQVLQAGCLEQMSLQPYHVWNEILMAVLLQNDVPSDRESVVTITI